MTRRRSRPRTAPAAWRTLERELGRALALMGEDEWQYLVLSDQRTSRYVQFAVRAEAPLRAEAVSDDYLAPAQALGKAQAKALVDLGWTPPPARAKAARPGRKPKRPSNFFREFDRPVDHAEVAALAVRTLRDVFQTPFPARLDYRAFEKGGKDILVPTLELVRHRAAKEKPARPPALEEIRQEVLTALRESSGIATLDYDAEGDLSFRFGSAFVILRLHEDPPYARVHAPVLTNVEPSRELGNRLNELNREVRFARLFELRGTVWASVEVLTRPLVPEHVVHACESIGELASGLDEDLQAEFGGKTAFGPKRAEPGKLADRGPGEPPRPVGFRVS